MLRNILIVGASALSLAVAAPAIAQDAEETPLPTMEFGEWGVDTTQIDPAIDPGDDFFGYVNSKWIADNPIPSDRSRFGAFDLLAEKSSADVKSMIEELVESPPAAGSDERRILDAYNAFFDTDAINAAGLTPAYPYLTRIFEADALEDLATLFPQAGFSSMIATSVGIDSKQPDTYAVSVGFDGMGLPSRDYYLEDNEKNLEIREAYKKYLTFLAGKAGYADPEATANAIYEFEHKVAELEWDVAALRNRDITYNKLTRDEVQAFAPEFPLAAVLEEAGFGEVETLLVRQIPPTDEEVAEAGIDAELRAKIGGGLPAMMQLLSDYDLNTIKAFMAVHFLNNYAPYLPSEIDDAQFEFFGKTLSGQPEQRPRWKRAISATEGQLGEVLGKAYAARYFPQSSKDAMDELVANLRKSQAKGIRDNSWMSDETKVEALAKLEAFNTKIGYPDNFETYEGLEVAADTPLENAIAASRWRIADNRAKLGGPIDREEWFMLPQTVNAYYSSQLNEIVFPAAILQPPFFNPTADPAVNYGAIGAVIGHEIGHGFDDQGAKSDGTGKLRNWWADSDKEAFETFGDKVVEQYNSYCPLDDGETCVNGRLSLGENLGDIGGLSMALRAYKMSLNGAEAPVIDGLTGEQRFFLAFAQVWRTAQREASLRRQLLTGPHSPAQFRTNGTVRNMDEWYKAFDVAEDDDLYLPPEQRVKVW